MAYPRAPLALTPKQALFVRHYVRTLNATEAAKAAGYSPKTAETQGSRLFRNAQVQAAIQQAGQKALDRVEFDADKVLQGFATRAFGDWRQLFDADGQLRKPQDISELAARLVVGFEARQELTLDAKGEPAAAVLTKVKLADPLRALESLAKYYQLFKDADDVLDDKALAEMPPEKLAQLRAKAVEARELLKNLLRGDAAGER